MHNYHTTQILTHGIAVMDRETPCIQGLETLQLVRNVCHQKEQRLHAAGGAHAHRGAEELARHHPHRCSAKFDYALIRSLKPFPEWLEGEMRSNHAGETGAVNIYAGAKWALQARESLSR